MKTFRFDDVCINADMKVIQDITDYLFERFEGCLIIWAISPLVSNNCGQRVFPKEWNAMSDHTIFYSVDKCGIPKIDPRVRVASHGICHVDHRHLNYEAQEMSIDISCK